MCLSLFITQIAAAGCSSDPVVGARGCSVTPSLWLSDTLTPAAREVIYPALARHPANRLHAEPALRPVELGPWADMPDLSPRAAALLARATWTVRRHHAFSDVAWLCASLPSPGERAAVMRALYDRVGALVQTASLVALDIVFVKDGGDRSDPWVLERLGSLLARHGGSTPRLWRRR